MTGAGVVDVGISILARIALLWSLLSVDFRQMSVG